MGEVAEFDSILIIQMNDKGWNIPNTGLDMHKIIAILSAVRDELVKRHEEEHTSEEYNPVLDEEPIK